MRLPYSDRDSCPGRQAVPPPALVMEVELAARLRIDAQRVPLSRERGGHLPDLSPQSSLLHGQLADPYGGITVNALHVHPSVDIIEPPDLLR